MSELKLFIWEGWYNDGGGYIGQLTAIAQSKELAKQMLMDATENSYERHNITQALETEPEIYPIKPTAIIKY